VPIDRGIWQRTCAEEICYWHVLDVNNLISAYLNMQALHRRITSPWWDGLG